MKSAKTTFLKGLKTLTVVGLFTLVLGFSLIPLAKVSATTPPNIDLAASPVTVNSGSSSNLYWDSNGAVSCSAGGGWSGSKDLSGFQPTGPLQQDTTFTLTCTNSTGQSATVSVAVTVNQVQNSPTVTLSANPTSIQAGNFSTLSWDSQNASFCSAPWTPSTAISGSQPVSPGVTTTYNITCSNSSGQQATAQATVNVSQVQNSPFVTLTASPQTIQYGGNSTLYWNSQYTNSCSAYWTGNTSPSGSGIVVPTSTTTYSITCYGTNGQQVTAQATVSVNNYIAPYVPPYVPPYIPRYVPPIINNPRPTVVLYANQSTVAYNGAATVSWITTNATSCYASGGSVGWAGVKGIGPASFYTGSLTSGKTYTITCNNVYGSATDSVVIGVRGLVRTNPVTPTSYVIINSSVDRNQPIVPTIDNTRPHPGDEINYTVTYQNIGTASIANLTLQMNLPFEVDYISSNPNNPTISGNTLTFNLGTLKANGQGTVTVRVRVRDNIPPGTNLNFPATLSYTDPSGQRQSVSANVSAQVWSEPSVVNQNTNTTVQPQVQIGANAFLAGFLPNNIFGWLLLLILILILVLLAKYLFGGEAPFISKKTTTTTVQ